ncbi:hypothetical protein CVT24_013389 [Panaeolus cyanescens]|uniref:G domain-containing protein n=1 Tax=Panaeolus cyanescens TaxID=181874 RepID=A0A409YMT1_9AGAR|nr:hypothetical protein CVT24_013389 [Panaeolus cyanescens]
MGQLTKIRTTGTVSIEQVDCIPPGSKYTVLIVGQTGVGKSSLIETFSTEKPLGIAKDQLESVTQTVTGYKLINVERNLSGHNFVPMYIVDTPGFSDPRISEMKVINMILKFTAENNIDSYSRILYLDRITDTRMSGSKGRNLSIFKALTGEKSAKRITIITTMWDQIFREDQKEKALKRFDQLKDGFWEDFVKEGAKLVKFENNQESTLMLLDGWRSAYQGQKFGFEQMTLDHQDIRNTPIGAPVYQTLVDRIAGLKLKLQSIEVDLSDEATQENPELLAFFTKNKVESESRLAMFEQELLDFGPPPEELVIHSESAVQVVENVTNAASPSAPATETAINTTTIPEPSVTLPSEAAPSVIGIEPSSDALTKSPPPSRQSHSPDLPSKDNVTLEGHLHSASVETSKISSRPPVGEAPKRRRIVRILLRVQKRLKKLLNLSSS